MDGSRNIVVTGFGPFGVHKVNASWEAVKLLKAKSGEELKRLFNVHLVVEEIPVVYDYVSMRVPEIWKQYDPLFVVHVGVSHKAECLTIESRACSSGYTRADVMKQCPAEREHQCSTLDVLLDLPKICKTAGDDYNCITSISNNAGRYLCEFTLFQSLAIKQHRSVFIHVPDFDVLSTEETERGIFSIICCIIQSIKTE